MKNVFLLIIGLAMFSLQAQSETVDVNSNIVRSFDASVVDGKAKTGFYSIIFNPPKAVDGSVYVYDSWKNNALISTEGGNLLRLSNNINFNAKENVFESRIGKDSLYTFDFSNIEKMVVNNKTYRNVFSPIYNGFRLMEVVVETNEFSIFKDYKIDIRRGSPNPMLAHINDKYLMSYNYYVKTSTSFRKFKLKKANFLKLAGSKSDKLEVFAQKNRLDFKDEKDLEKIASYYGSL